MYRISGSIPEKITMVSGPKQIIKVDWNDFVYEDSKEEKTQEVWPAWICDSTKTETIEKARSWAQSKYNNYQSEKVPDDKKVITEENLPNEPFTGIKVVGLEYRGEGGRAYKVILPNGYYFDLREDVLLDLAVTLLFLLLVAYYHYQKP